MNVSGDGGASFKFPQHRHATARFVLVEDEQFDTGIRAWLPRFVLS
jgi:hypothetical protein